MSLYKYLFAVAMIGVSASTVQAASECSVKTKTAHVINGNCKDVSVKGNVFIKEKHKCVDPKGWKEGVACKKYVSKSILRDRARQAIKNAQDIVESTRREGDFAGQRIPDFMSRGGCPVVDADNLRVSKNKYRYVHSNDCKTVYIYPRENIKLNMEKVFSSTTKEDCDVISGNYASSILVQNKTKEVKNSLALAETDEDKNKAKEELERLEQLGEDFSKDYLKSYNRVGDTYNFIADSVIEQKDLDILNERESLVSFPDSTVKFRRSFVVGPITIGSEKFSINATSKASDPAVVYDETQYKILDVVNSIFEFKKDKQSADVHNGDTSYVDSQILFTGGASCAFNQDEDMDQIILVKRAYQQPMNMNLHIRATLDVASVQSKDIFLYSDSTEQNNLKEKNYDYTKNISRLLGSSVKIHIQTESNELFNTFLKGWKSCEEAEAGEVQSEEVEKKCREVSLVQDLRDQLYLEAYDELISKNDELSLIDVLGKDGKETEIFKQAKRDKKVISTPYAVCAKKKKWYKGRGCKRWETRYSNKVIYIDEKINTDVNLNLSVGFSSEIEYKANEIVHDDKSVSFKLNLKKEGE